MGTYSIWYSMMIYPVEVIYLSARAFRSLRSSTGWHCWISESPVHELGNNLKNIQVLQQILKRVKSSTSPWWQILTKCSMHTHTHRIHPHTYRHYFGDTIFLFACIRLCPDTPQENAMPYQKILITICFAIHIQANRVSWSFNEVVNDSPLHLIATDWHSLFLHSPPMNRSIRPD